jgi:hypothetical protein
MKLDLEEPYKSDFKAAYCYKNKEPRRVVSLVKNDGSRTCTSYARYLMSCHLERYLEEDEHVDHINEDPLDDRVENLQILSPEENRKKSNEEHYAILRCPVCEEKFEIKWRNTFIQKNKNKKYTACSRSCGGKAGFMNRSELESKCEIIKEYWK